MASWMKRILSAVAVAFLALGGVTASGAVGHAEEAVLIPGATVFKEINPLYPLIAQTYPIIGINFHDDDHPQLVDYSQNALASDRALRNGVARAARVVDEIDGPVVVIGESMGSMVASRLARTLANSAEPPSKDDIRFVLIAPPEAGVAKWFKVGTFIPLLNYRVSRVPESPYHTTIVIGEYDFWADPPDRPWNLISLANAVMGMAFVHGPPIAAADPANVPKANTTTTTNSAGGTVVTHFVPTPKLPLTQVFRLIGVPDKIVDQADRILRPIVDAGYRRHDKPGDTRPYLANGGIHRNVQAQQQARDGAAASVSKKAADAPKRRKRVRDREDRRLHQPTTRSTDRRAERRRDPVSAESTSGSSEQPE
ncbi:PE-PPE domain-containing protein [Mycobacterium sp. ACS1612]|uniref:PE-PPE domain-containing protein n=1 Tax=Mycobacterium sp. ACS1612 TaxID=1834117 RepID=UPI000800690D|nr:PE-PPE domain-containing protein [Mycobacterium sp. ACS1612]OBF31599.1 PE-PPE domain-containing protein [Mycobacterium sp. ACS1612]